MLAKTGVTMFVVFGSPRSGTTLLKEMLCQHPDLIIPHETDFIIPMAFILDRVQDEKVGKKLIVDMICSTVAFESSLGRYLDRLGICEIVEGSQYSLSDLLGGLYAAIARKTGSIAAGDKSPNDLGFLGILKKMNFFESNIKIIHIIRDVRDVVLSLKKTEWSPPNIEYSFPRNWANSNLNLNLFASQGKTPYLKVRYEDLILDAPAELKRIATHLEVKFNQLMCCYSDLGKELSHLSYHQNLGKEMLQNRRFAWKQNADTTCIEICQLQSVEALRVFGYECS